MHMTQMVKRLYLLITLLLVSIIPLSAGSTGKIRGRIIDSESNQPLVGVNIYLSNWEAVLFSVDRLTNFDISNKKINVNKIGVNDKICKKKYLLYFTEAHLCLNKTHEKKFKEYEKTLHKILPPYLFFRSFLNL